MLFVYVYARRVLIGIYQVVWGQSIISKNFKISIHFLVSFFCLPLLLEFHNFQFSTLEWLSNVHHKENSLVASAEGVASRVIISVGISISAIFIVSAFLLLHVKPRSVLMIKCSCPSVSLFRSRSPCSFPRSLNKLKSTMPNVQVHFHCHAS